MNRKKELSVEEKKMREIQTWLHNWLLETSRQVTEIRQKWEAERQERKWARLTMPPTD